jgi:hypothetical protein
VAKAKKPVPARSQAQRLLEAVKKARASEGEGAFARSTGKSTLAKNARKTAKGQIGG